MLDESTRLLIADTSDALDLSPAVIEKDYYVTQALSILADIKDDYSELIFAGGTCLAKAHHLVKRMSEDVDFKIQRKPEHEGLSKNQYSKMLKLYRERIIASLEKLGDVKDIIVRNAGGYLSLKINYLSSFPPSLQLRPHILIEFTSSTLQLPPHVLPVTTLVRETLGGTVPSISCTLTCISVAETAAEKWVGLTRRLSAIDRGYYQDDETLIRHVYDLAAIRAEHPLETQFFELVQKVILKDANQFKNQYPEYFANSITEIKRSLAILRNQPKWEDRYNTFLTDMVHDINAKQPYHEALNFIEKLSNEVIQTLPDHTILKYAFPAQDDVDINEQDVSTRKKATKDNNKKSFHEQVAEKIIERLQAGTAPWQKPWKESNRVGSIPYNPMTGKRYKGGNALYLMCYGYQDPRWMTYKQAAGAEAQVRKGEKGTLIQYWKFNEERVKTDTNGNPLVDDQGKPIKISIALERPKVFYATVFNAEQIEGLPPLQPPIPTETQTWQAIERAEQILKISGAEIYHGEKNGAFYNSRTDTIHLPDKNQFPSSAHYYATALHELGHWTGHASRLDRDLLIPFGSIAYAKEELRAEIASMILGEELGIGHDPGQHIAYVKSWIQVLQDEPLELFRAAADAEKIQEYVLDLENKLVKHQEIENSNYLSPEEMRMYTIENSPPMFDQDEYTRDEDYRSYENTYLAIPTERVDEAKEWGAKWNEKYQLWFLPAGQDSAGYLQSEFYYSTDPEKASIQQQIINNKRIYLNVPYAQKEEAKKLGARWDRQMQSWYIPAGINASKFTQFTTNPDISSKEITKLNQSSRLYLAVPYGERQAAKLMGAKWDKEKKSWYVNDTINLEKIKRWMPENISEQQMPSLSPREEFSEMLKSVGCIVNDEHPIMDGQKHRITVEGDRSSEQAGFYVGHLDGHPAGYIKNNRTGVEIKWKSKGYVLTSEQKAVLQSNATEKLQARATEEKQLHEKTALRVAQQIKELFPVTQATPYLLDKKITSHADIFTDSTGQKTYIPVIDENGKQWSMQTIYEDGTKRFAKNGRKEGCFHVIGGLESLAKAPIVVIAEGYATAATLYESLGYATVTAFDAGNLVSVAKVLHEKFPDKAILIAGDNDHYVEVTQGINPGQVKAKEAAHAVGGHAIFPIFAPGEQASHPKSFTDFNDLATKSVLGRESLDRQVRSVVEEILNKHQKHDIVQKQVKHRSQKRSLA